MSPLKSLETSENTKQMECVLLCFSSCEFCFVLMYFCFSGLDIVGDSRGVSTVRLNN